MRNQEDINFNQCDRCGKFVGHKNLECGYEDTEWEGIALCKNCLRESKEKET